MFALSIFSQPYPQREDTLEPSWLDQLTERFRMKWLVSYRFKSKRLDAMVDEVSRKVVALSVMDVKERKRELLTICSDLRRCGFTKPTFTTRALAMAQIVATETLGLTPHPVQIKGAYILLGGQVAEMDTGEGKTLTASLAAACAAMAGLKVHVITVNDYLAERDAATLLPFFSALGFTISVVQQDMSHEEKQQAYRADVVYCANKIIVFDYLRDRVALGERMRPFAMAVDKLAGLSPPLVSLPGLQFAIVDEADSVFVDEARTPLIISEDSRDPEMDAYYQQAINFALALKLKDDYELLDRGRFPRLTQSGRDHLQKVAEKLSGLWQGEKRREEAIIQALVALHGFKRDVDYIVRDGKVMIVDENTGRVMPDRSWERGLQQLMELKEGLETTPLKKTLARLSYQIFFRRYVNLCGMTGTCREVKSELGEVYGMGVVRVHPHKPSKRVHLPTRLFSTGAQRWQIVAQDIKQRHERGQPVLVGTRSILASEYLSQLLTDRDITHQVLNAKQNGDEAIIVSCAGEFGRVTIATNMAGRGTDIKLAHGVAEKGGLHVILTEGHDNRRVDRQLAGRCARQGDPGSWQEILSMDDELMKHYPLWMLHFLVKGLVRSAGVQPVHLMCLALYRLAQKLTSAKHRRVRVQLLKAEYQNRRTLSFSGTTE
ncbi:MAG: preprotein translocase subunit SecA [Glaciimonas sp.]|nr:preprotein translocase subunit SecA [Glaciimonas sp.]